MNALTIARAEIDPIATAVESANHWLVAARPIIKAWLLIDDAPVQPLLEARRADRTAFGPYSRMSPEARAWDEAYTAIRNCRAELFEMLDGIRDNYLCDEWPPQPDADAPLSEWAARDEAMEEVGRQVISVDAAIKIVEGEL